MPFGSMLEAITNFARCIAEMLATRVYENNHHPMHCIDHPAYQISGPRLRTDVAPRIANGPRRLLREAGGKLLAGQMGGSSPGATNDCSTASYYSATRSRLKPATI
jgi:hypothetical protein